MKDICLHALTNDCNIYRSFKSYESLQRVLKTGFLLSRRQQGIRTSEGFNGIDYISLCDYQKREIRRDSEPKTNAYESYIRHYLSLMFSKDELKIIEPFILDTSKGNLEYFNLISKLGMSEPTRYTDLPDEVQVKDQIPLSLMNGITIPIRRIRTPLCGSEANTRNIIKDLSKLKKLLTSYGYDIPIYDIDTMLELKDEEDVKKLVKHYQKI